MFLINSLKQYLFVIERTLSRKLTSDEKQLAAAAFADRQPAAEFLRALADA